MVGSIPRMGAYVKKKKKKCELIEFDTILNYNNDIKSE